MTEPLTPEEIAFHDPRCSTCGVTLDAARPSDEVTGLREALIATLRRDDLCDETDGEHHTDDYIAAFLVALDVELQGRAALANTKEPDGG